MSIEPKNRDVWSSNCRALYSKSINRMKMQPTEKENAVETYVSGKCWISKITRNTTLSKNGQRA